MDINRRNLENMHPIQSFLDEVDTLNSSENLIETIINLNQNRLNFFFIFYAQPDLKNSKLQVLYLDASGLNLPTSNNRGQNKDYYLNEKFENIREAYLDYIQKLFRQIGIENENSIEYSKVVLEFETLLAKITYANTDKRIPEKNYHKFTLDEFTKLTSKFQWKAIIKKYSSVAVPYIIVNNPEYFKRLNELISEVSLDKWKIILKFNILNSSAGYLNENLESIKFDFYGKLLSGQQQQLPLEERVANTVNADLGELIGKAYCAQYFPESSKILINKMLKYIKRALEDRINSLEWMSDETKPKAIKKLNSLKTKMGYPDVWRDYSTLEIPKNASFFDMYRIVSAFNVNYNLDNLYKPPREEQWGMSPQTINAYYNPPRSEIVFPAGILQYPMFDPDTMEISEIYGAIGMTIGHEISHGFDDQGRKFDAEGNLSEWWSEDDIKHFSERAAYYEKEYNSYQIEGKHVNGTLTLGENIADMAGIILAYFAMKKHQAAEAFDDPKDSTFTHDQLYFLSYARSWCDKNRKEESHRRIMIDTHSPEIWRVNGPLANFPVFHNLWDIKKGDKMYRENIPKLW